MKLLMQVRFCVTRGVAIIKAPRIKKNLVASLPTFFLIFNINHCYAVAVGESYGGGTVFCVSQTPDITQCVPKGSGDYGLIMANEDQVNYDSNSQHGVTWSSQRVATGARSEDDGAANTAAIIAAFPQDNPSNNAAWLCHNYRDLEGHSDWYLPSKNELKKMYIYAHAHGLIGRGCAGSRAGGVQCLVGGGDYNIYWSSGESSSGSNAWGQGFSRDGGQYYSSKLSGYFGVRAVRSFGNLTTQRFNTLFSRGEAIAGALVVMDNVDEKLLQDIVRDSTDNRVKRVISALFERNRLLAQLPAGKGMDDRVAVLRGIMHGEEFHNLTGDEQRLITAIRNTQLEIIRGLQELRLPLPSFEFWPLTNLMGMDINLIKEFIVRLKVDRSIKTLNLSNIDLSTLIEPLIELLTVRTDFTTIILAHANLAGMNLRRILAALQSNYAIAEINIAGNGFTSELQAQFRALEARNFNARLLPAAQNPKTPTARLQAIIAFPAISPEILAAVAENPNTDLEGLNTIFHHPTVNPAILAVVRHRIFAAQAGLIDPYLISIKDGKYELRLNNIKISEPLATEIAEKLQHNEIASIVIYDGRNRTPTVFKGSSLQIIVTALKGCKGLTRFIFNTDGMRGGVGIREFQELLTALCGQQELRQLYLQGHFLGEAVVPEIAAILRNNPHLTEVGLGGNNFGPSRAGELIAALIDHRELRRLNLAANHLGEAVIPDLIATLRNNPHLTEIELRENGFGCLERLSSEQLAAALKGELEQVDLQAELFLTLARNPNIGKELLRTIANQPHVNQHINDPGVLAAVAVHPQADFNLLLSIAERKEAGVATLLAIVQNPNLSLENLNTLLHNPNINRNINDPRVVAAIVAHPNADANLLLEIARKPDSCAPIFDALTANPNINQQILTAVAAHPNADPVSLLRIVGRNDIAGSILATIVTNRNVKPQILAAIAAHPHTDTNLLIEIAKRADADAATLLAVARNPITNLPGLRTIIHNRNIDPRVLIAIANHPNVDGELLGGVAMDKFADAEVLAAVSRNRNADASALQAAVKGGACGLGLDVDSLLIVAHHPNANQEILSEITSKRNIDNRILAALANHPNGDFGVLYDVVQHPQADTNILLTVAQNPNADEFVLDAIVRRENINVEILATVAANPNAGPDALGAIARNPLTNPSLLNIVLHHRHVTVEALRDIARNKQTDIEELKMVANYPDVTVEVLDTIARHDRCNGELQRILKSRRQALLTAHNGAPGETNMLPQGNNTGAAPQGSSSLLSFISLPPPPYMHNDK